MPPPRPIVSLAALVLAAICGCHTPGLSAREIFELRQESLQRLKLLCTTHQDPELRGQAIRALQEAPGPDTRPWIRQGLHDPDTHVQARSALAIAAARDTQATVILQDLLPTSNEVVRAAALLGLVRGGQPGYQDALEELLNESTALRSSAAAIPVLLEASDLLTEDQIRRWLKGAGPDEWPLQYAARCGLLKKNDAETTSEVILQARSGDIPQQCQALEMLAFSVDPAVVYVLLERLQNSPDLACRLAAAVALSRFDSAAGAELAMDTLGYQAPGPEPHQVQQVRSRACEVLGAIRDPRSLIAVSQALRSEHSAAVQVACARAALQLTGPDSEWLP